MDDQMHGGKSGTSATNAQRDDEGELEDRQFSAASHLRNNGSIVSTTSKTQVNLGKFLRSRTGSRMHALMNRNRESLMCDEGAEPDESLVGRFRSICEAAVLSSSFETCSAGVIAVNGFVIGWQTDYMAQNVAESVPPHLRALEALFCFVFTSELAIRLFALRGQFFLVESAAWNVFDLVLVVLQLVEVLVNAVLEAQGAADGTSAAGGGTGVTPLSLIRLLRILRLVRVVRMMRVLRYVGELRALALSILGCMKPFFWTLILLSMVLYIFGVYFAQLVVHHRTSYPDETFVELENYYGSLSQTVLGLFQSMTGGVDWNVMINPIIDDISPFLGFTFVLYIAFTMLAMMNVVTAVFVDSALTRAREDKEIHVVSTASALFQKLGLDRAEHGITWEDFEELLDSEDMLEFFKTIGVEVSDAKGLFTLLDVNDSDRVQSNEFLSGCLRLRGSAKSLDLLLLARETRRVFQKYNAHLHSVNSKLGQIARDLRPAAPNPTQSRLASDRGQMRTHPDPQARSADPGGKPASSELGVVIRPARRAPLSDMSLSSR